MMIAVSSTSSALMPSTAELVRDAERRHQRRTARRTGSRPRPGRRSDRPTATATSETPVPRRAVHRTSSGRWRAANMMTRALDERRPGHDREDREAAHRAHPAQHDERPARRPPRRRRSPAPGPSGCGAADRPPTTRPGADDVEDAVHEVAIRPADDAREPASRTPRYTATTTSSIQNFASAARRIGPNSAASRVGVESRGADRSATPAGCRPSAAPTAIGVSQPG